MNSTTRIHFFSYKSAFLFFSFILVFNFIFNTLMNAFGIDKQLSLYLGNTFAISAGLTIVIILVEGKFKNKKQATLLFLSLLAVSALVCYAIIYA
ncbi:hypothetical protein ACWF7H_17790 [Peribacillus butanolivorans]|uniref:hypothetical protein n=1 Tax=Peribacillus TaxID=2675229 RepID=UPI0006F207A2|nr:MULTISPECIES: hypothetical protein [unclassified Peribacillus]KQU20443.1 hypothetical protein ASG65_05195 [Bacillus sp. Leaf13]KRF63600.1 hypothetical protein ASG99_05605 [Bacillus sp. Soil768D1]MBK5442258.1 hypothetical protein [Peribacillus sp. TH24]MBK5462991.1 hypothetical protein [Peribacillus sp. TH27]MBK5483665.1 hypothetical protein [Peribacillus sp. TH16]